MGQVPEIRTGKNHNTGWLLIGLVLLSLFILGLPWWAPATYYFFFRPEEAKARVLAGSNELVKQDAVSVSRPFSRPIPPPEDINSASLMLVPLRAFMIEGDSRVVVFEKPNGDFAQFPLPGTVQVELDKFYLVVPVDGCKTFREIPRSCIDLETGLFKWPADNIGP